MRKLCILFSFLLFLTVVTAPKAFGQIELFGGYSHLELSNAPSNIGSSSNGWADGAYLHLLGPLGFEADFSNHYGLSPTLPPDNSTYYVPQLTVLYGPRFTLRLPRIHPYVHALFGTVHGVAQKILFCSGTGRLIACESALATDNAAALAFGGGLDVKATRHVWLRLIQVNYLRAQFSQNAQNDTTISAGLVFRFGRW